MWYCVAVALHVRLVFVKSLTLAKRAWRVTRKAWWFWQREPGESLESIERPGCHACGMVCCDGLAPVFISPHGNEGFGPVWGSALYTMLRVLFRCPSFLHWGIRPWVIQNPPQDTVRAACALLLGLCCFLPPVLAAFPGAFSLLLLLASACCLPPRPCSLFGFLCPLRCLCVFLGVVCCPFLASFCGCWVCFCLVFTRPLLGGLVAQLVGCRSWRRGQTASGGSIPR